MLRIVIDGEEQWDDENEKFIYPNRVVVKLEHSLVSLSKWEAKFEKPFLTEDPKTSEELAVYVECMILDTDEPEKIVPLFTQEHVDRIQTYIDSKQTATWFNEKPNGRRNTQVITNELVYYWLFSAGLDISCQHWHLNRLFTQLRVHSAHNEQAQNGGKKKFTSQDAKSRAAENERRRKLYGSSG